MIVLKAIGAFFVKIWNWIKETAWVQPLLIVGLIFGVIFSIPSIVNGITALNDDLNSDENFYRGYQKSLVDNTASEADKLTNYIWDRTEGNEVSASDKATYGDKFFLVYVASDCDACKTAREGFEVLRDNFGSSYQPDDKLDFKMYTIFADEVTSDTTTTQTAFVQYMIRFSYFFEEAAGVGYASDYYLNGKISDTDLGHVENIDPDDFTTPTIMLVDFTETSPEQGVSEIMFSVSGDNSYKKAELLLDCWNHSGDFKIQ